jgi:hypothetical protein
MMSQQMYTHKGGDDMQHWKSCKILLYLNIILVMVLSLALMGCPDDSDHGDTFNIEEEFRLTNANAAALAGIPFTFADGSIFGPQCAEDEPATLTFGEAGDTFILVCGVDGDTTIDGTITFASCRFEDNDGPFNRLFPGCACIVIADNVPPGGCNDGTVQLDLTRANGETQVSGTTDTPVCINNNDDVTIGDIDNTPLGPLPTGGTGGTGD